MKKIITIVLTSLCLYNIGYASELCEDEYNQYIESYSQVQEILEEKVNLREDINQRYKGSPSIMADTAYASEYDKIITRFYKLEIELNEYFDLFEKCKVIEEEKLNEKSKLISEYFINGNKAFKDGDILKSIEFYKKAKELTTSKEIRDNLSIAYFQFANGVLYKGNIEEAIKYYNLSLNEGYGKKYYLYFNLGISYYEKAKNNNLNKEDVETAILYYEKALNFTSEKENIKDANEKIKELREVVFNNEKKLEEKTKNELNTKLKNKSNLILEKLKELTNKYSGLKRVRLYNKYISLLSKYSNNLKRGDKKTIIIFLIEGMKKEIDNKFE
ncbi:MAG: hypothetical protein QM490_05170 [Candidatus Gracilibacteria bacterium]